MLSGLVMAESTRDAPFPGRWEQHRGLTEIATGIEVETGPEDQ